MKILVIGGTGHVATHLLPMLMQNGHRVTVATRGQKNKRIDGVEYLTCNAGDIESLKSLQPMGFQTVIDFPGHAQHVWEVFCDTADHIIACGSLWMFGYPHIVPTPERTQETCRFEGYAKRYQQLIDIFADSYRRRSVFTAIMPPNICGPGKIPLDTMGGRSIEVHRANMRGETVYLPEGPEALIGPCDAEDIARLFALAVDNRTAAAGQFFNVGSEYALTSTRFVQTYGRIHTVDIPVEYLPWERYIGEINPDLGAWWHFWAHMLPNISKAKTLLGYAPRYTPEETLARAVSWMHQEAML